MSADVQEAINAKDVPPGSEGDMPVTASITAVVVRMESAPPDLLFKIVPDISSVKYMFSPLSKAIPLLLKPAAPDPVAVRI